VVIVSVPRKSLRDEFAMADESFALSPISARATLPSEQDYDAIREAFMETSRGRWFLGEYAKRNRNADTRMVLDAVARIEDTLAAQKKTIADAGLDEALAAIRSALDEARIAASTALGDAALAENLVPVRKGARVIREISWRLREIGADGRICDLIDSQVNAIEGASARIAEIDPAGALGSAFDLVEGRITALEDRDESDRDGTASAPQPVGEAVPSPPEAAEEVYASDARADGETVASPFRADDEAPRGVAETVQAVSIVREAEAATDDAVTTLEPVEATVDTAEAIPEPADAFSAQDEAVLDMIAAEMAAPDSDEAYEPPASEILASAVHENAAYENAAYESAAHDSEIRESEAAVQTPARPVAAASQPEPVTAPAVEAVTEPSVPPSLEPSLGSSLLATGIVQRPRASRPDPLAPIRRMSQTERIAFFS
jgi:hypothetical protein